MAGTETRDPEKKRLTRFRVSESEQAQIERAAGVVGAASPSEFVRNAALRSAREAEDQEDAERELRRMSRELEERGLVGWEVAWEWHGGGWGKEFADGTLSIYQVPDGWDWRAIGGYGWPLPRPGTMGPWESHIGAARASLAWATEWQWTEVQAGSTEKPDKLKQP